MPEVGASPGFGGWDEWGWGCGQRMWGKGCFPGVGLELLCRTVVGNRAVITPSWAHPPPTHLWPLDLLPARDPLFAPLCHRIPRRRWRYLLTALHPTSLEPTTTDSPPCWDVSRHQPHGQYAPHPLLTDLSVTSAFQFLSPSFVSFFLFNGKLQTDTQIWRMTTWTPIHPDSATIHLAVSVYEHLGCTS